MKVYGVDFTCAPRKAKPITVAAGVLHKKSFHLEKIEGLQTFLDFEAFLSRPGPWIGGFDFPFALPARLVADLGWPAEWKKLVRHCASITRLELRALLDRYRSRRSPGAKYLHRATDYPAGSSSPMKLVNPPVALMFHEGARRLLAAGLRIPALAERDDSRVALEAYPGLLVRKQLAMRASYKSDARREQTPERKRARKRIVEALKEGEPLGVRLSASRAIEKALVEDGSGDSLDAAICAVQAAWASSKPRFGFPAQAFAGEGWIVSA